MVGAEIRVFKQLGDFVTSLIGQDTTRDTVTKSLGSHPLDPYRLPRAPGSPPALLLLIRAPR
jgi:hypothetical protein